MPIPSEDTIAIGVDVKPQTKMQSMSITTVSEVTPPDSPFHESNKPENDTAESKISKFDTKPQAAVTTLATEPEDTSKYTAGVDVTETTPPDSPVNESNVPGGTVSKTNEKPETQDLLPISTTQLDDKSSYAAVPASTESYQDTVTTSPTTVESPQLAHSLSPASRLKHKLQHTTDLIVCPGVYDGLSARIAQAVGFETLYMTGAGSTASMLGMADLGIASRNDMVRNADMIANLDSHHFELIADMDTGYGGPITITQTVNQYIRANVAAFHIEDQVLTKRCGHLSGKKVVSNDVYLSRIRAARAAIDMAHADMQLIARTDANQQLGYDECMVRLKAARDLGADVGLLEGFKSKEEAAKAVKELAPWPLLLNIVENGHSPLITVDEAREMGFRIMIFSFAALAPAYMAIKSTCEKLKYQGVTGMQGNGVGPKVLFDVCGLQEAVKVDENAGGEDYKGMA